MQLRLTEALANDTSAMNGNADTNRLPPLSGGANLAASGGLASSTPDSITSPVATSTAGDLSTESIDAKSSPLQPPEPVAELSQNGGRTDGSQTSSASKKLRTHAYGDAYPFYKSVFPSPDRKGVSDEIVINYGESGGKRSFVPKLTKAEYFVTPPIVEMETMSEADLATISNFNIERPGYGSVSWDGDVDVRHIDLDVAVSIEERDVAVYDAEEAVGTKPPVGSKLNRPAVITMYNIYHKDGPNADEAIIQKFRRRIEKQTSKMGAELVSYDYSKGEWKFRVRHFSRYALDDSDDDDEEESQKQQNLDAGERSRRSPDKADYNKPELRGGVFGTPMAEYDDGAFVSDAESAENNEETNVIQAAEDAYAMLQDSNELYNTDFSMMDIGDEEEKEPFFPGESMLLEETSEKPSREDFQMHPSVAEGPGICSILSQRCGISSTTSSKTDFGMRMGRSFRVGWNPRTGSFLHLRPTPKGGPQILDQSRPVFNKEGENCDQISHLQTHLRHSIQGVIKENVKLFTLPKGIDAPGGTPSSYKRLCDALTEYIQSNKSQRSGAGELEESLVATRAFSLLMCLYGLDDGDIPSPERRIEGFAWWLKMACTSDVLNDIQQANQKNDVHSAIFASVAGGDIEQACSIASKHGYCQLAAMISATPAAKDDIISQISSWNDSGAVNHIPAIVLRTYNLLSGELGLEEKIYSSRNGMASGNNLDWRRRLAMLLFARTTDNVDCQRCLSTLVNDYNDGVKLGVSPFPFPRYVTDVSSTRTDKTKCLLYRILELQQHSCGDAKTERQALLSSVISPEGHTPSKHNFSTTFHLASILSALGCCQPLSSFQEGTLIQSYAAQLINEGLWEWAVYVLLCAFESTSTEELRLKQEQAKNLVLQHYNENNQLNNRKRSFLEQNIGIPKSWFEEALANRYFNNGDAFGYVNRLSAFSPEKAQAAFEELLLPNLLFTKPADLSETLNLLELFGTVPGTLSSTTLNFFRLSQNVLQLSKMDKIERENTIPSIIDKAIDIQATFVSYKTSIVGTTAHRRDGLRSYPEYKTATYASFLSEALAGTSFLLFQLRAMENGASIFDKSQKQGGNGLSLKVASQLTFLSAADSSVLDDSNGPSKQSILRGLI